ncbi:MAG: nucleotide exchange factor GrpE [Candidatus Peribacteria bacterium]|jgi:molecular chaperone GrpE|nr:nucleotide exchange factor GrpE [Candidatus Peribacteria bacterium]
MNKKPQTEKPDIQKLLQEVETQKEELLKMQTLVAEKEEIAKKAQIEYINLKSDFDFLLRQTKLKEENLEQEIVMKTVKKLLPFVEDLRKSLETLSADQKQESLGQGVQMVYEKLLKALADFSIFPIESMGVEPDLRFHEPVGTQPATTKSEKGKIIKVFEQGFYFKKGEDKITMLPSKVIIAA